MAKKKVTNGNGHNASERIVKLEILCELSAEEYTKKSEALAERDLEINRLKEEAREKAAGYRESIKLLVEDRDKLAGIVDTHKENRLVECIQEANFERNVIITKVRQSGEHVSERPMEVEEREAMAQGRMPWDVAPLPEEQVNDVEDSPRATA